MEKCLPEKLEVLDETRRNVTGSTTNPIWTALVSNTDRHGKRPVSNRPSHDMATHQILRFITFFTSACNWSLSTAILNQHTSSRHYKIPHNISVQSAPESSMLLRASAEIFEYISHLSYVSPVSNWYKRRYFALKWRPLPTPNNDDSGTTFYTHYSS